MANVGIRCSVVLTTARVTSLDCARAVAPITAHGILVITLLSKVECSISAQRRTLIRIRSCAVDSATFVPILDFALRIATIAVDAVLVVALFSGVERTVAAQRGAYIRIGCRVVYAAARIAIFHCALVVAAVP